jgi:hypothetical protein
VVRPQIKAEIDSLDATAAALQKQESAETTDERAMAVTKELSALNVSLDNIKDGQPVTVFQVTEGLNAMAQRFVEARTMVGYVSRLQDLLTEDGEEFDSQRSDIKAAFAKLSDVTRKIEDDRLVMNPTSKHLIDTITGQMAVLDFELQALIWQDAVFKRGIQTRNAFSREYRICTYVWYGLACISGILAIAAVFVDD